MELHKIDTSSDEEPLTITIYDELGAPYPAADGSPSTVTVLGQESKRYRKAKERWNQQNRRRKLSDDENWLGLVACAVIAWHGWEDAQGASMPCTLENVRSMLGYQHIMAQVSQAFTEHKRFLVASSQESTSIS